MSTTQTDAERADKALTRYTLITQLFDQAFRVPGTSWRFGIDAIIGLVPGAGDLVGALVGGYGILVARQLGAPGSVQMRMLMNLAIDALVGAIPLLGDLFDFAFKANVRNRVLLEHWRVRPHQARRSSRASLLAMLLVLFGIVAGSIWLAIRAVEWLYAACCAGTVSI